MSEPKDCRVIDGGEAVIISKSTAEVAQELLWERVKKGQGMLYADVWSFLCAQMRELDLAAGETVSERKAQLDKWLKEECDPCKTCGRCREACDGNTCCQDCSHPRACEKQ